MKKLYIVKYQREFNDIIKKGNVIKNKEFVVYYKKNSFPYDRYGISVGTKLGNAVFRNKYKRKIRSIVDNTQKNKNTYTDFIILLRKSATTLTYQELQESFSLLMNKIRKDKPNEEKK